MPETVFVQYEEVVPGFTQVSVVQELLSLQAELLLQAMVPTGGRGRLQLTVTPPQVPTHCQRYSVEESGILFNPPVMQELFEPPHIPLMGNLIVLQEAFVPPF